MMIQDDWSSWSGGGGGGGGDDQDDFGDSPESSLTPEPLPPPPMEQVSPIPADRDKTGKVHAAPVRKPAVKAKAKAIRTTAQCSSRRRNSSSNTIRKAAARPAAR